MLTLIVCFVFLKSSGFVEALKHAISNRFYYNVNIYFFLKVRMLKLVNLYSNIM